MTEQQFKTLAELVLVNDARLTHITDILNAVIESRLGDSDAPGANALRSDIEQLHALSRDSAAAGRRGSFSGSDFHFQTMHPVSELNDMQNPDDISRIQVAIMQRHSRSLSLISHRTHDGQPPGRFPTDRRRSTAIPSHLTGGR